MVSLDTRPTSWTVAVESLSIRSRLRSVWVPMSVKVAPRISAMAARMASRSAVRDARVATRSRSTSVRSVALVRERFEHDGSLGGNERGCAGDKSRDGAKVFVDRAEPPVDVLNIVDGFVRISRSD